MVSFVNRLYKKLVTAVKKTDLCNSVVLWRLIRKILLDVMESNNVEDLA